MPEAAWAGLFLTNGFTHCVWLAVNGARWWSPIIRFWAAFMAGSLYLLWCANIAAFDPASTGVFTYGALSLRIMGHLRLCPARCAVCREDFIVPSLITPELLTAIGGLLGTGGVIALVRVWREPSPKPGSPDAAAVALARIPARQTTLPVAWGP